ncbi:uncharacterized protein Culd, partial [Tenebrio molitor]|uniref:uncharacterized protein Culd n=1 Tax=Tenebrio molitor TaxID=7067 RepID=UPI003624A8E0
NPGITFISLLCPSNTRSEDNKFLDDICGHINGQRIYLEYGETGTLEAKYENNIFDRFVRSRSGAQKRCTVEFISCPSCIIKIKFTFLNLSRNCERSSVFDTCGCDYVWIYQPTFEQSSEQFCGRFLHNNISQLEYNSQTRKVVVAFLYNKHYEHAFTLDYYTDRNKIHLTGFPKFGNANNASQTLSTPFFPNLYPSDLTMEHVVTCESTNETCRITLVFTDFLVAAASIIDVFDWNGERIYVTTGDLFRPAVITSSGSALMIRFYANGATNLGFKAYYSFLLGQASDVQRAPDIDCGGHVNNLGGAITMMDMVQEGMKSFDCIWLIKPPETYLHMKTHLYVKVVKFAGFAGRTELTIRQGLTSNGPLVENLKLSMTHFYLSKEREHIVPISQGFYIRLKGLFLPESRLALVYAAFNYKDCLAGSDLLCHNKRCISSLLKCDGFDHCGDNSDEYTITCSKDPRDRRQWSKTPHFYFPKVEGLSELTTTTLAFLLTSFGLIGFIFAMIVLLYKINIKTRQERQIQDHIETINAIIEEGVGDVEEEIIIPDDPPDYEAPPDYSDVVKMSSKTKGKRCSRCNTLRHSCNGTTGGKYVETNGVQGTSRSCQTTPTRIPDSPPPAYNEGSVKSSPSDNQEGGCSSSSGFLESRRINIFQNLRLLSPSRNCICGNLLFNRLICRTRKTKSFSDPELTCSSNDHSTIYDTSQSLNEFQFKKSFTTDDMNSFI